MSKTIVVENSFEVGAMKKISKSSLGRMRKDALVDLAVKFGWSDSHATKPLNKMIKEDFINFILQMADVFRDDISLDASLGNPSISVTPSATPSAVSETPTESETPIASVAESETPIASVAESETPIASVAESETPIASPKTTSIVESLETSLVSETASVKFPEPSKKRFRGDSVRTKLGEIKKKDEPLSLKNLTLDDSTSTTHMTRDFASLRLGAVPKKRPPPLNLPLVESVVLDRRRRVEEHNLPQLVESTLPPTRETSIFQFPEKVEASESGIRLRNAKELSDVLVEIKERNNDDLTTLDDIDSLLSRAFGVVS